MSFTSQPLSVEDLAALAAAFAPAPYNKPSAQYERYLEEHGAGARVTLLARTDDGAVIGYVNVLWRSDYPRFVAADVPEINDLNVVVPWRRRGVGKALIAAAEAVTGARGSERIGIGVGMTPDYDAARRLYPALGYVRDGTGPHPTPYGDVEYLTKPLDASARAT